MENDRAATTGKLAAVQASRRPADQPSRCGHSLPSKRASRMSHDDAMPSVRPCPVRRFCAAYHLPAARGTHLVAKVDDAAVELLVGEDAVEDLAHGLAARLAVARRDAEQDLRRRRLAGVVRHGGRSGCGERGWSGLASAAVPGWSGAEAGAKLARHANVRAAAIAERARISRGCASARTSKSASSRAVHWHLSCMDPWRRESTWQRAWARHSTLLRAARPRRIATISHCMQGDSSLPSPHCWYATYA